MKNCWLIILIAALLSGCTGGSFETIGSVPQTPSTVPAMAQILVQLPQDAAADVLAGEEQTFYSCDTYSIFMQTLEAGDLQGTVTTLCGYSPDNLMVLRTFSGSADRYDWVWTSAGEEGDLVGRAAVIDDGSYHYCLWVMAQAEEAGALSQEWNDLFGSFCLETA